MDGSPLDALLAHPSISHIGPRIEKLEQLTGNISSSDIEDKLYKVLGQLEECKTTMHIII